MKAGFTFGRPTPVVSIAVSASRVLTFETDPLAPSNSQTYLLLGKLLPDVIKVIAPSGFEISLNGIAWDTELETAKDFYGAVYVRLNSGTEGTYAGNISHECEGYATANVAVSGTVVADNVIAVDATDWFIFDSTYKQVWSK